MTDDLKGQYNYTNIVGFWGKMSCKYSADKIGDLIIF